MDKRSWCLAVLGLSPSASLIEIKTAYRKLAKLYHPDLNEKTQAGRNFQNLNEAYQYLIKTQDEAGPFAQQPKPAGPKAADKKPASHSRRLKFLWPVGAAIVVACSTAALKHQSSISIDKVNFQNAADLAASYAAMKQAELMHVIGHENYAIRQSWKLLAWRYHVLGTMGQYRGNSNPVWTGELSDTIWDASVAPPVCITYKPTWEEVPADEALCNFPNLKIPPLPKVKLVATNSYDIHPVVHDMPVELRKKFDPQCVMHGAYNWWFAMSILHAFRLDQRNRKRVIMGLANNLSAHYDSGSATSDGDFLDLDGNSVLEGARKTFLNNLSSANRAAFEAGVGKFKLLNSLAGVDPKKWLVEIKTMPTILYTDIDLSPGCNASVQVIENLPQRPMARELLLNQLQAGPLEQWRFVEEFSDNDDSNFSMGFEKNPWYMAYMGVGVSVHNTSVSAYAEPFGERIGPWYRSFWNRDDATSTGSKVDELLPPRVSAIGVLSEMNDMRRLPNFSRYPGDTLGMQSKLAVNELSGLAQLHISIFDYAAIASDGSRVKLNDPLAWNGIYESPPAVRQFELQAIAPDQFDLAYYSLEPNFAENYFPRLAANASLLGITQSEPIRADLGSSSLLQAFSVQNQVALAHREGNQRLDAFYFVREHASLQTACALPDGASKYRTPASCAAGERGSGISVKLISRDTLFSDEHRIGGLNVPPGRIQNPPNANEGW